MKYTLFVQRTSVYSVSLFQRDTIAVWVTQSPAQTHKIACPTPHQVRIPLQNSTLLDGFSFQIFSLKSKVCYPQSLLFLFCYDSFTQPEVNDAKLEWQNFCKIMTASFPCSQALHSYPSKSMTKIPLILAVTNPYPYETQVMTPSLEFIYILGVTYFSIKLWKTGCIKLQKNICIYLSGETT